MPERTLIQWIDVAPFESDALAKRCRDFAESR
jgi:hypothetical protein